MSTKLSTFSQELDNFINNESWTYAKTMPEWPHEYIVRKNVDEELFIKLVEHIRAMGYHGSFYQQKITYYDEGGLTYWTMGAPIAETTIINRCKTENSYENRLANNNLPD